MISYYKDFFNTVLISIAILLFFIRVYIQDGDLYSIFRRYFNFKYFLPISSREKPKISTIETINKIMYCFYTILFIVLILNIFYVVSI